jgi:hypothetical protein
MFRQDCTRLLASVAAAVVTGLTTPMAGAIEEPRYAVVREYDGFEIREYAPYLVAEVLVPGPAEDAGNQGFRILAAYIFGKNQGERKIAMTAPVTQAPAPAPAPAPARIEMTAPVTQAATDGGYVVQFAMPAGYTLETLPLPLDPRVELKQVPGGRYAVIRYSGTWSERNYREHLEKLERSVQAAGLRTTGSPIYSRYDAPFVPWFLRRNEIWLRLV